jgi:hypothetical protein
MDQLDLFIGMAASIIIGTVKNPAKKTQLKAVMLKIWKTIGSVYQGDPDFK